MFCPQRKGSLMSLSGTQAPCRASLAVLAPCGLAAPLGHSREAIGLIQLWAGLCGGMAWARCVGLSGKGVRGLSLAGELRWGDFSARGLVPWRFLGSWERTWFPAVSVGVL